MKTEVRRASQAGFSLLEVVITLAILVSMVFSISSLMRQSFDMKVSLAQKNRVTKELDLVMQRLAYDLGHAFLLDRNDPRSDLKARTLFQIVKGSAGDSLRMTYMGHEGRLAHAKEADISFVVYELKPSETDPQRRHLYRGEWPRIPSPDEEFKDNPQLQVFAHNIHSLKLEPWNGDAWQTDGWDSKRSDTANKLPHMLRVTLTAWDNEAGEGGEAEGGEEAVSQYSTIVYLPYALDAKELKMRTSSFKLQ